MVHDKVIEAVKRGKEDVEVTGSEVKMVDQ